MVTTTRLKVVSGSVSWLLLDVMVRVRVRGGVEPCPCIAMVMAAKVLIKPNILLARGDESVAIGYTKLMVLVIESGNSLRMSCVYAGMNVHT